MFFLWLNKKIYLKKARLVQLTLSCIGKVVSQDE